MKGQWFQTWQQIYNKTASGGKKNLLKCCNSLVKVQIFFKTNCISDISLKLPHLPSFCLNPLLRLVPLSGFSSAAAALRPSPAEIRSRRNAVFSREQERQRALYPRIEKIEVSLRGPGLDGTLLIMNKGMSTPLSCARRTYNRKHQTLKLKGKQPGLKYLCGSLRSDWVSCGQLGTGACGWRAVAPPPAPHWLLHPHSAHVQRQRPDSPQRGAAKTAKTQFFQGWSLVWESY